MGVVTEMIPVDVLRRFLRLQMSDCTVIVTAISGPHAYGYASESSPLELKGVHVEPTENLVGLSRPPRAYNWVGEHEGFRIDYSSLEIGEAMVRLLRGDGAILERIMGSRQLLENEDLRRLRRVTRGVICRRFFHHYRNFARGMTRELDSGEQRTVRHILTVYRIALTGVHLFRTGQVALRLMDLADLYNMSRLEELVRTYEQDVEAMLPQSSPWLNRIVKLHTLLESAFDNTQLPHDPENPGGVESYLLDMRRRFFDAPTIQQ